MSHEWYYLEPKAIQRSFNQAASSYNQFCVLQREVANRLISRLDYIKHHPKQILDLGAGTGVVTQILQQRFPTAQIFAVDFASAMLQQMQISSNSFAINANVLKLPFADHCVDFIVANFLLHWIQDFDALFKEWQRVLKPGGLIMFTLLGVETLKELRESFAAVDDHAHVHAFYDMHDVGDGLLQHGFVQPVMDMEYFTLTYPDVMSLLRELKAIGGKNIIHARRRKITGKNRMQKMLNYYEQLRTTDGLVPATYEVIYGIAWLGEPKVNKNQSEISIPLNKLKRIVGITGI